MIQPGEGIPATRNQAYSLLKAIDFDLEKLTDEQQQAIRTLYDLVPLPRGARYLEGAMR